jgi:putative transposase
MVKSYKFKLYPTAEQKEKLELALEICRQTYNQMLSLFSSASEGFSESEMKNYLLDLKSVDNRFVNNAYSTSLQLEAEKIYDNLSGLSELKRKGHKVGRLRYKGKGWKKTFVYKQSGFDVLNGSKKNNLLYLSKIGKIKMILHRKIEGKISQVIIKREIDNWFAIIQTDAVTRLKHGEKEIGIDFSPSKFGVCSDETIKLEMPRELDFTEKKLKKLHRELSRKKKGSNNRKKAIKRLQIGYKKLTNQKENHYHQTSYKLVTTCKLIGLEDLTLKKLMMISLNARDYQKSGWATYINQYLKYKAESASCEIWKCDRFEPTTQRCSCCGKLNPNKLTLQDRTFNCPFCNLSLDRDINASRNIKKYCKAGTVFCGVDTSTNTIKCSQVSARNLKFSRKKQEKIVEQSTKPPYL